MADASGSSATVRLGGAVGRGRDVEFSASGTRHHVPRFPAAYDEGADDAGRRARTRERRLPQLAVGDAAGHAVGSSPRATTPARPLATPRRRWSKRWRSGASAARRPTPSIMRHHPGPRLRLGEGLGAGADLARLRGDRAAGAALPAWSTTTSPPAWRRTSTGSPAARAARRVAAPVLLRQRPTGGTDGGIARAGGLKSLVDDLGEIDAREINSIPLGEDRDGARSSYGSAATARTSSAARRRGRRANVPEDLAPDELTSRRLASCSRRPVR